MLSTPLVLNNNNNELNLISCGCAHVFTQSRRTCRAPLDAKPRPTLQGSHSLTTRPSDWVILGQHADGATPFAACGPGSSVSAITVQTTRRDGTARAGDGRGRPGMACGARTLAPRGEARPCGRAPALRGGIACFDRCLPCASAPGMTGALTTANCSPYPLQNHMNAHWVRRETHVLCSLCRKCVDPEMQKELGRAGCLVCS